MEEFFQVQRQKKEVIIVAKNHVVTLLVNQKASDHLLLVFRVWCYIDRIKNEGASDMVDLNVLACHISKSPHLIIILTSNKQPFFFFFFSSLISCSYITHQNERVQFRS